MTNQHPQEIELKLQLPPGAVDAFLARMARRRARPVALTFVTRYFDTPDFALSAAGVALRVRRAGRRWLQTLKTEGARQGGLSRRIEFEMPTRGGALDWTRFPPEALAYVPEALRGEVVPVFETHFRRTAWQVNGRAGARIEVALDVGEIVAGARSQPISEIELELKAGQPDALFALALEWAGAFGCLPLDLSKAERGVRLARGVAAAPMKSAEVALGHGLSVEDGFAAIVQGCLAHFQANLPGVLASDDIEYVHQARVALRRLRAALRLFRGACVVPQALMAGARGLAASLGPARDWDVLVVETLPAIAPHYPDADAWQCGLTAIEARRQEVRAAMRAALGAAQPGAWLLGMQRWLLQQGWRADVTQAQRLAQLAPLDDWTRRVLKRGHRRIARDARAFGALSPVARHALRIAIKRQRYAVEFFQPLFAGKRQARYLAILRDAQDSLGRANDARVASTLMAAVGAAAGPMADFVRGWLAARLAAGDDAACAAHMQTFLDTPTFW
ncbi:MAG: CHAD domain-containing protein [Pseudomonadota bacterium]